MTSIKSIWDYNSVTGELSITLVDSTFATGAPTFETWVDNTGSSSDTISPDFKNIGQAGGSSVVELSNDNKTVSVKSGWISNFKLDNNENAIYIRVYNANNSRQNLLYLTNEQGLTVETSGGQQYATILTESVSSTSGSGTSGSIGDPYIITLDNQLYKMCNFEGYSRMLQGYYNNKLLTINVETKTTRIGEANESYQYVVDNLEQFKDSVETEFLDKFDESQANFYDSNEAFMTKLYIQYDSNYMLIDMNKLAILDNNSNFKYSNPIKNKEFHMNQMEHYYRSINNSMTVFINDLKINIYLFQNPQIKTGFNIDNGHLITQAQGALIKKCYKKDIKIKKLNSIKPIISTNNRIPRRIKTEIYLNDKNEYIEKDIEIY